MIDINLLRADPEKVKNILKIKNYDLDSGLFTEIDSNRKTLQTEVEDLKSLKNKLSNCLLYTSPSPRDISGSRMPSSA